ncbi:MAG: Holliday junction resolvase RuvX [bacterium]|nr:Holliday junction resolvase RuvX [bacterium]
MERVLAVDYGRRRIGVAVSDALGMTAQGLPTLAIRGKQDAVAAVAAEAVEWQAGTILVGLPLNMDGSRGGMADEVEAFAEALRLQTGLPVRCWDERWTSQEAHRAMQKMGLSSRNNKGAVDRISATLLLDGYLRSLSHSNGPYE